MNQGKALGFYQAPNYDATTKTGYVVYAQPVYYCPSDRPGTIWKGDNNYRARGNYVVNFGPDVLFTAGGRPAPFYWLSANDMKTPPSANGYAYYTPGPGRKFLDFTDGLSNTLLMSEIRMPPASAPTDARADVFNDRGGLYFMAYNTPNAGSDSATQGCSSDDPTMPCGSLGGNYLSARSRHTGGVNVVLSDGSVRFVQNTVGSPTWQALSTISDTTGGEVIGDY